MDGIDSGREALISGIEKDAKQEAERIIKEAEKRATEITIYTKKQVDSIVREAEEKSKAQFEAITKKVLSGVDIEVKRKSLYMKEKIIGAVLEGVKEEFWKLIKKPEYQEVLLGWIVEAAVGLGAEEAEVSVSKDEMALVDFQLLKKAEKQAKQLSGKHIKLSISDGPSGTKQGVILTAADGRTAFNNQISTRLLRKQREIRDIIYRELFGE